MRLLFVFLTFSCRYHLKDVIVGKIYFVLVRVKIRHMEIDIIKRESTGSGPNVYHENETVAKYEIMDGAPVRGEKSGFLSSLVCGAFLLGHCVLMCLWLLLLQGNPSPSGCF